MVYTDLFELVKSKSLELDFHLKSKSIVIYVEPAIHNSVKEIFLDNNKAFGFI